MNDKATAVLASSIVFSILAVACGITRVWAKKSSGISLSIDDWIIVINMPLAFGLAVAAEYMAGQSLVGGDIEAFPLSSVLAFQKFLFAAEVIVTFVVGTVKISVLLFYKKIFTRPRFQLIANVLIACCIGWTIAFILVIIFQSSPVSGAWDPVIKSHHPYKLGAMWVGMGTTDILLDLSILFLPVPMIASLHLPRTRKILVGMIFAMGAFCVVASAARLVYFVRVIPVSGSPGADFSDSVADTIIWSVIEACVSIIVSSLLALGPLFQTGGGIHKVALSFRNLLGSRAPTAGTGVESVRAERSFSYDVEAKD